MSDPNHQHFETAVLVHLEAAYNLARWLLGDVASAEDAVQSACLKAMRGLGSMTGPNPKGWFMAVVRNCCTDQLRERKTQSSQDEYDDDLHGHHGHAVSAEGNAVRAEEVRRVRESIAALPMEFREVIVLRELEGMSYKEISAVVKVPIGTVMSRLSRARERLAECLADQRERRSS